MIKTFLAAMAVTALATSATARDNIQIAGSSTVLPYSSIVAEVFGENTDYPVPVVESGGSSSGLKRFCEGVGLNTIDIANASRPMRDSEVEACAENGVTDITEIRIGYDGIVFASDIDGPEFQFKQSHWFMALNPNTGQDIVNWNQISSDLPDQKIFALIPGTKHGTREVFEEYVLLKGCENTGYYEKFLEQTGDEDRAEQMCIQVRTDGVSVDIDGDYTETLARIETNKQAIGVFGLSFYENNTDKLQVATMEGVSPSAQTVASAEYPVSRPLFFYVKNAHVGVVPALKLFVQFFVDDAIAGPNGPLAAYGLVSDPELKTTQEVAAGL